MAFPISKKYIEADPRKLADWQVAEIAEEHMPTVAQAQEMLGLRGRNHSRELCRLTS
jgi:hypothetical protein